MTHDLDYGTAERHKRGNVRTVARDTALGGDDGAVDIWHDFPAFCADQGLIDGWHYSAWQHFAALCPDFRGHFLGPDGDPEAQSRSDAWLELSRMIGPARRELIERFGKLDVPPAGKPELIWVAKCSFNLISVKVRDALSAAGDAAQEVRKRREGGQPTQDGQNASRGL